MQVSWDGLSIVAFCENVIYKARETVFYHRGNLKHDSRKSIFDEIDHFRVTLYLCFKTSPRVKPCI